ncbi:MAG: hypothetical protein BGN92_13525 [Sphingobacteriales bacterium 41-5]|nr:MAG: hypothetical protein BGN92_13525 [Sphingobacteriales bacterium 41-5]
MDTMFFKFIKPVLEYIDKGFFFRKPLSWLYYAFAIINLVIPLYFIFAYKSELEYASGGVIFSIVLIWLILCFTCWCGFQLWWNRANDVKQASTADDNFHAIPALSNFIQTLGEWYGLLVGMFGTGSILVALIFANGYLGRDFSRVLIPFLGNYGSFGILIVPLIGFLIVVVFRAIAEGMRALTSIANNTKNNTFTTKTLVSMSPENATAPKDSVGEHEKFEKLKQLKSLLDSGILTPQEYERQKSNLLNG